MSHGLIDAAPFSRLLAGLSLALMAAALAGCNDNVAEKAEPPRPVLLATAHYDAETPERSFVGTIRPRTESDLSFRVAGKVAKRLVEVGQTVEVGQPLATLDEVDLKLQAEQAAAEQTAATGRGFIVRRPNKGEAAAPAAASKPVAVCPGQRLVTTTPCMRNSSCRASPKEST